VGPPAPVTTGRADATTAIQDESGGDAPLPRTGRRVQAVALAVVAVSTAIFVLTDHRYVGAGVRALSSLGPSTLVFALAVVVAGIMTRGVHAYVAYRMFGMPTRLGTMVRVSASSHAVGKVTRSGGVAGLLPYYSEARRSGRPVGPVVGAYACMQATTMIAMTLVILTALVIALSTGAFRGVALGGTAMAMAGLTVAAAGVAAIGRRRNWPRRIIGVIGRTAARVRRRPTPEIGHDVIGALNRMREDRRAAVALVLAAIAGKLVGAAGLVCVLHGLGVHIGVFRTVLIYVLSQVAGSVGPLPAGVGTADAALGALLLVSHAATATIAGAVIAFRLLDLWAPLIVGGLAGIRRRATPRGTTNSVA
jgi:uncharacterized membrane protein YbhN (UPF0104 family)